MTPGTALLFSFLVPGSVQFMRGQTLRGAIGMLLCLGSFFAGYAILGDRLFYCVLFEPMDLLAGLTRILPINLLPDVCNAGPAVIASLMRDLPTEPALLAEATRQMRVPVPFEHLGFWLCGSSGVFACLVAADARNLVSGEPEAPRNRAWVAGLSFLLPGSGHVLLGQKDKGILMGVAVWIMFFLGLAVSGWCTVDRAQHGAYWIVQSLFGGGALLSAFAFGPLEIPQPIPQFYTLGITLAAVAGLMNLVVMIDAYSIADRQSKPDLASAAEEATA